MNITDHELDAKAFQVSKGIHKQSLILIKYLIEIDRRKSFAEHGFHSLFMYIVKYLGFSEAQAAVYNRVVKSRVIECKPVEKMLTKGEISLSLLGLLGKHIKENKNEFNSEAKKLKLVEKFKGNSRNEAKKKLESIKNIGITSPGKELQSDKMKWKPKLTNKTHEKLKKVKRKYNLDHLTDEQTIDFLIAEKLYQGEKLEKQRSITKKSKEILLVKAKYRCQFKTGKGSQCSCTENLEVEHIKPRAKGGDNDPNNLTILCRAHNLRNAVKEFGNFARVG